MKVIPPVSFGAGSFTRAGSGTYYNSSGILATATTNVLRVGYNRTTLQCTGAIIENAATNILLYSRDLTQTSWVKTNATALKDQTGVDGVTATASSLLATSIDATVLQSNTLASSARVFSANIKRLVGTGSVYITGDNGATWTDITALISTTAWSRVSVAVQIVTNPISGFKIATSGDKIAVDYVQNETSVLTSEILTTTIAVTRPADVVATGLHSDVAEPYTCSAAAWNSITAYNQGDHVHYLYKIYKRIVAGTTATLPSIDNTNWIYVGPYEVVYTDATYAVDDERIVLENSHRYLCLIAGAKTIRPDLDPTNWLDLGKTNKWAMFDTLRNTGTIYNSNTLTVLIKPGTRIDSIALLSTDATYAVISIVVNGEVIYRKVGIPPHRDTAGWYDFFFAPLETFGDYIDFALIPMSSATICVTFINDAQAISCGACVIGLHVDIGSVQWNASSDALNFSSVERDDFGNTTMVPRRSVPKTNQKIFVENQYINKVRKLRTDINAVSAVWSGVDDDVDSPAYEALLVLGFYRTFTIDMENILYSTITLELEEV